MRWILSHSWPGNVRELANAIERAVTLSDHDTILLEDLHQTPAHTGGGVSLEEAALRGAPLEEVEALYARKVFERAGRNKSKAARLLGIDRRTLDRKLGLAE